MTEKQWWARKRNWLIMRLMGASSIFNHSNREFMQISLTEEEYEHAAAANLHLTKLVIAMRDSVYPEGKRVK